MNFHFIMRNLERNGESKPSGFSLNNSFSFSLDFFFSLFSFFFFFLVSFNRLHLHMHLYVIEIKAGCRGNHIIIKHINFLKISEKKIYIVVGCELQCALWMWYIHFELLLWFGRNQVYETFETITKVIFHFSIENSGFMFSKNSTIRVLIH